LGSRETGAKGATTTVLAGVFGGTAGIGCAGGAATRVEAGEDVGTTEGDWVRTGEERREPGSGGQAERTGAATLAMGEVGMVPGVDGTGGAGGDLIV
jgi:hypothetical protein